LHITSAIRYGQEEDGRSMNTLTGARFIDTHAHLSFLGERGIDIHECVQGLFAGNFGGIIDIGTGADDLAGRLAAFSRYRRVRFSAGIWPYREAAARGPELVRELERQIAAAPKGLVVAVGECGLDYHHRVLALEPETGEDREKAAELLFLQLDLADRLGLPAIIHSRDAPEDTIRLLSLRSGFRGVIHCFSYTKEEARAFLDLGCYLSFAGNLSYRNAQPLRDALAYVPEDRLLLETDAPYLAPVPLRGRPSDPGMVAHTYALAAELRHTDITALTARIAANTEALFGVSF
jgi:TatD DNase family protein